MSIAKKIEKATCRGQIRGPAGCLVDSWETENVQRTGIENLAVVAQLTTPNPGYNTLQLLPRDASAERGYETAFVRPSVCPSVCNDQVPWSNRLEFFENNFTAE